MGDHHASPDSGVLVLSRADVESLLDTSDLRAMLERSFIAHSAGGTSVPPRVAAASSDGILAAMPGNVDGVGLGIKAVTVFPANHGTGIPSHQGAIVMFDPADGRPVAVMDAAAITEVRTAVSALVAADLCTPPTATVLAVLGAGALGATHLAAFASMRPWTDIRVASRSQESAARLAARHPPAVAVASFADAVDGADVVCLCTDATEPFVDTGWFGVSAHVSSVGRGAELPADLVAQAAREGRLVVEWCGAASSAPPAGAEELQGLDPTAVLELGDVLSGAARLGPGGRTVYKSTGHAMEDIAAARVVLDAAHRAGRGTVVPF